MYDASMRLHRSEGGRDAGWLLRALVLAGVVAAAPCARAEEPALPPGLEPGGVARVATALDGDTLILADGRTVRLVGVEAPKPPLDAAPARRWPLAEAAHSALAELAAERMIALGFGGRRTDRYGRLLAHLYLEDGLWLQGELLSRGMARVLTAPDNRALAKEMLARESEARAARRGIWASELYAVRAPSEARHHLESFEIVEGTVAAVTRVSTHTDLALGIAGGDGLTVALLPESRRLFKASGLDPEGFVGRQLRVRGWLRWWKGPRLEVSHPEQIELLPP